MKMMTADNIQSMLDIDFDSVNVARAVVTATGGIIVYIVGERIVRYLVLRRKRLQSSKECREQKQLFLEKMRNHENKEAINRMDDITSLPLSELIQKLQNSEISAVDVMVAYQAKAAFEDVEYNFMTTPIWEAQDEAKRASTKLQEMPLFGVPISIKDHLAVKGYDACLGYSAYAGQKSTEDSVLVKVLRMQGAIPFIKTTVPQSLMSYACDDLIHGGHTKNPHDRSRGPGGSSGGEAAALAASASILGFGTDLIGSVRVPASYCGVYGLHTSTNRISCVGLSIIKSPHSCVTGSIGPMARDVDSLAIAMRSILVPEMFKLDPEVIPLPFQDQIYQSQRPLRIGYYVDFEAFAVVPASKRAVLLAKDTLERMGHELILWEPPQSKYAITELLWPAIWGDGGAGYCMMLKDDALTPCIKSIYYWSSLPYIAKTILSWIIRPFSKDLSTEIAGLRGQTSVADGCNLTEKIKTWRRGFNIDWIDNKLDAVICPSIGPALPIGYPEKAFPLWAFTCLYNLLNYTAGVLPVTKVTREDEDGMKNYPVRNMWHGAVKEGLSKGTVGLPVNVQVVTLPYQDEQCLRVMKDIETGLNRSSTK